MTDNTILYLNWPPTVNNYYSHTRNGVFISAKGRRYASAVADDIQEQLGNMHIEGSVLMEVKMYPPDRRKRDLDNHMKALQDAIVKAGLLEDDSLINQLFIYRGEVVKGGLIVVELSESGPILPYIDSAQST